MCQHSMKGFDDFLPSHIIKLENIMAWRTHSNIMYTEYAFLALLSQTHLPSVSVYLISN